MSECDSAIRPARLYFPQLSQAGPLQPDYYPSAVVLQASSDQSTIDILHILNRHARWIRRFSQQLAGRGPDVELARIPVTAHQTFFGYGNSAYVIVNGELGLQSERSPVTFLNAGRAS